MDTLVSDKPNLTPEVVPVQNSTGLDAIAEKMAAMRNQSPATNPTETGVKVEAKSSAPVAPEGTEEEFLSDEPEVVAPEEEYSSEASEEEVAPETQVSESDSSSEDIIDFLEFAEQHPNAKFKFKRNGKEIEVDAKKAAAILGQGAAISEDARQLKVDKAEFDEYLTHKRAETEGLLLAMEFTIQPQLQKAYDEIVKTQNYQTTFQQQLAQAQDPATRARIQASMQQNERYIAQMGQQINQIKPQVDQFYQMRAEQVKGILDSNRKGFKDKELRNEYVYNEIRDKVAKGWSGAEGQLVPGIKNIDLISSDEHLMSLVRDGLKYRDRPKAKSAGSSIAALTTPKRSGNSIEAGKDRLTNLQEQARAGDKKAQDNLLVAKMNAMRSRRG